MCWPVRKSRKTSELKVSVAGCLGYDVLATARLRRTASCRFQLLVV